jgi:hypothetical protein
VGKASEEASRDLKELNGFKDLPSRRFGSLFPATGLAKLEFGT